MRTIFTFLFSILVIGVAQAQYAGEIATNMGVGSSANAGAIATIDDAIEGVGSAKKEYLTKDFSGSPYVNTKFAASTLFYNDEKIGPIYYRHNALNEEVEIMKANIEGELVKSLARDKNINILVNGKKMSFKTFITAKKRTTNGYLTQLITGENYDLYKRVLVKFTEGTPRQNSFVAAVPARFTQFTEYYFQKKGVNRIDELITKNSKLLKLIEGEDKTKAKTFLKENSLNIKKENDLIKAFEFLNTK